MTVTADAILFDGYNYLISYTLEKEDGSAFDLSLIHISSGRAFEDRCTTGRRSTFF